MEFIRKNINASSATNNSTSGSGYNTVSTGGTLETHTIFGQPYNGTNDVKGDLSDVDKITANGDISTDGMFIIKGKDSDDAYNDLDLKISLDNDGTHIEGGQEYFIDNTVNAPLFVGNIEADQAIANEVYANNANISNTLNSNEINATKAEIQQLLSGEIEVDKLTVSKSAHFFSLIIDEIKSVGGQIILSPANATLDLVSVITGNYKCYFKAKIGEERISNQFALNDLVVCQTFNVAEGTTYNTSNKFYWRKVVGKGSEVLNGVDYHYVVLSGTDCDENSSIPEAGDMIVTLGNKTNTDRQNAIILSAFNSDFLDSGIKAPSIVQYTGINNYELTSHRYNVISRNLNVFRGDFQVTSGEYITELIENQQYNRMILNKAMAVVGADDILRLYVSGSVIPVKDESYNIQMNNPDIHFGYTFTITNNNFSYTNENFTKNYSSLSIKPTYFHLKLTQGNKVVESETIPVIFEAGSVLNVMNDKIEAAVTDVEGDIARVELKADSITNTVANIKVGGRNLIDDSEFITYSDSTNSTWTKKNASASTSFGYMNQIGIHKINNPSNNGSSGYLDIAEQSLQYKLKPDTYYTFSFYAKGYDGGSSVNGTSYNYKGRVTTYVYPNVGSELADNVRTFTLTNQYKRYYYTFKTRTDLEESGSYSCLFRLRSTVENGTTYYSNAFICMPKLEEGTMATAWDTNDADMKSYVTQKADLIESKIVTEDTINSKISQSTSNIKAEVYNDLNESTGIDIATGTITLNADKTIFNGNINIRNSDEGVVVFDDKGNASVIIQNKQIPSLSNLDNSAHDYITTSEFTKTSTNNFASASQKVGSAKVGDTIIIDGGGFYFCYKNSSGNIYAIPLSSTSYLEYYYTLKNTTTGKTTNTTAQKLTATTSDLEGGYLNGNTFNVTEDGNYEVVLHLKHCNPTATYSAYHIVWGYYLDKNVSQYTQLGTNGLVSVQDQYKYLYFGNEGFEARINQYNGFRISGSRCQQVIDERDGNTIWGSLVSKCDVAVNPSTVSMAVKAGTTSMGTKNVVRADGDQYYDVDLFVFRNLTTEVWVKLPSSTININGVNYVIQEGRTIRIRNLTSQKCYVYIDESGYKMYPKSGTSGAYYYSIGSESAEFIWDGYEWIRMY